MTGPGGDEVARVSVKVVPNTDDFKRDLERQLRDIRDAEIRIPVKLDIDKADLERQLQELRTEDIRIPVKFNVEDVRDDVERATSGLEADPVTVPVNLSQADLEEEIQEVMARLHELDREEVSPEVILEVTEAKARLRELKAQLAALSLERYDIRIGEDGITEVRASIFSLQASLAELQRDPVQIDFDLREADLLRNIARIEAELDRLDGTTVTPEVGVRIAEALAELAALQAALNQLDDQRIEAIAELDVDTRRGSARIDAFFARLRSRRDLTVPLDVQINEQTLAGQIARLGTRFAGLGDKLAEIFDGIGGAVGAVVSNIGQISSALFIAGNAAVRVGVLIASLGAVSGVLAMAGAAITAAWGGISTILATIPGALALIGAPIAAVALGMDGVKKAAKSLKPEFDALKASVSATFERGLTPVFDRLSKLFPALTVGLNGVATGLSNSASMMSLFLTSSTGIALIEGMFRNIKQAIEEMTPGLVDITSGILELANHKGAFDALTTAVNTFGAAFRQNVTDTVKDGTLTAAFTGLEAMLAALARGFADLVKNGIELFAAAAPGLTSFLNDLTAFFNRFNWTELGSSVGGVFRGLGEALRQVPQSTILAIEGAFRKLSDTFQSAGFQRGVVLLVQSIPAAITALDLLIQAFVRTGLAATGFVQVLTGIGRAIGAIAAGLADPIGLISGKFKGEFDKANEEVNAGLRNIGAAFSEFKPTIPPGQIAGGFSAEMDTVVATAETKMAALRAALEKGMSAAQQAMVGGWKGTGSATVAAATAALAPVPAVGSAAGKGFFEAWDAELDRMDAGTGEKLEVIKGTVGAEMAQVPPAAGAALAPLPGEVSGALGQVPAAANAALAPLEQLQVLQNMKTSFGVAFMGLVGTAKLGMDSLAATVAAGMPGIQASFNFTNVGSQIGLAFMGMVGTFNLGMASLAATVTAGMPGVVAAFNFQNVGLQIGLAFQGLIGSVTLGMQSIAATVTANMALVTAAFNFTNIGLTVGQAFLSLVGSVTLGMQSIVVAVQAGMTQVLAAFNFTNVGLTVGTAFLGIVGTVNLGMASIAATVTTGMASVAAAFNFSGVHAAVGVAFLGLVGTVNLGMASITAAVTSGVAQANASLSAGFGSMAGVAQGGMSQVVAAIQAGMATAVAAVVSAGARIGAAAQASMAGFGNSIRSGMAAATSAVSAGTAQMIAQFIRLGQQIITTATAAMASFGNSVRSGMAQAQAAVASGVAGMVGALRAGQGQFYSVGVAMMAGLRSGILSQAGSIAAAAAAVVRGAVAAARAAAQVRSPSKAFMEIGVYFGEGLALGMEKSVPRVEAAADKMANAAVDSADRIGSAFSGSVLSGGLSTKVEHSFGELAAQTSDADVVGQLRALNGNVDQSAYFATLIAEVRALRQAVQSGSATGVAATARTAAALGAF